MKTKLCRPVLVDSEIANIYKCRTGGLGYKEVATSYTVEGQGQQLILISLDPDEKIEEGDICYYENYLGGGKFLVIYTKYGTYHKLNTDLIKQYGTIEGGITPLEQDIFKVIAQQSQFPLEYIQQFIEEYNKGEVKDVKIEMERLYSYEAADEFDEVGFCGFRPKLTNGFITIVEKSNIEKQTDLVEETAFENLKVKEPITYTEEEVKQLFIDRAKEFSPASKVFGDFLLKQDLNWFEQNKKK